MQMRRREEGNVRKGKKEEEENIHKWGEWGVEERQNEGSYRQRLEME
jgi:hypothetical protein